MKNEKFMDKTEWQDVLPVIEEYFEALKAPIDISSLVDVTPKDIVEEITEEVLEEFEEEEE